MFHQWFCNGLYSPPHPPLLPKQPPSPNPLIPPHPHPRRHIAYFFLFFLILCKKVVFLLIFVKTMQNLMNRIMYFGKKKRAPARYRNVTGLWGFTKAALVPLSSQALSACMLAATRAATRAPACINDSAPCTGRRNSGTRRQPSGRGPIRGSDSIIC